MLCLLLFFLAGVIKNIIPAVASTNAVIAGKYTWSVLMWHIIIVLAAACATEVFKLATRYVEGLLYSALFSRSVFVSHKIFENIPDLEDLFLTSLSTAVKVELLEHNKHCTNNGCKYYSTIIVLCSCSKPLQNYMVFNDTDGVYTYTFEYERKVCITI